MRVGNGMVLAYGLPGPAMARSPVHPGVVRNFERVFTREVGSQYVLQLHVEAARRELERPNKGLKQVASAAGFCGIWTNNADILRRSSN